MFHTHFRNGCRRRSDIQQASATEDEEDDDELLNMPVLNPPICQLFSDSDDEMLDLEISNSGLMLSPRHNALTTAQIDQLDDELLDMPVLNINTVLASPTPTATAASHIVELDDDQIDELDDDQIDELDDELMSLPVSNANVHLSPLPRPPQSCQATLPAPGTPRLRHHSGEEDDVIDIELPGFSPEEVRLRYKDGLLQLSTKNAKKCNEPGLSRRYAWEIQVTQRPKQIVCGMEKGLLRLILPRGDSAPELSHSPVEGLMPIEVSISSEFF
ncbi:hypothetical protein PLEOSDRAFT_154780 [Pleurotus ostreatus PC15]|uniref:SHSP domain-containing protein n=1 Tax=Pleurotus ostreatus (strain PC15) TaxID=1137138 RepID=A0A067P2H0_PLEO1|nr:hypothetical protein PLEOSDRAFT_154780 [Pleurotus ostreatus PC15]